MGGRAVTPHLQYLAYVARHKWFVLLAGLRTGAPLWRLVIHDWSKFTSAEWGPYVRKFYDPDRARPDEFERAWLHHQHRNPHHWQHWLLREDSGTIKLLPMPDSLVREMVADWMGAGRAITGRWDVGSWWEGNRDRIRLHSEVEQLIVRLIDEVQ